MDEKEIIRDLIKHNEESVEFFSNNNKQARERWVASRFLSNLSIDFKDNEIVSSDDEPPDVNFRDSRFEIKEILDKDRQRHRECRVNLEKAKSATKLSDFFQPYSPREIMIQNIVELIEEKLSDYIIEPQLCPTIDMLFYINLQNVHFVKSSEYLFTDVSLWQKWRSVSMYENGNISFVFVANDDAPEFLKTNVGKFISKKTL